MQTYSHWLITAVLRPKIQRKRAQKQSAALLAGSVLPDVPLMLLSVGYALDRHILRPYLPDKTRCSPTYDDLYFHNPWWIAAHNIFHAPLPLFLFGLIGYLGRRRVWGGRLFWFAVGCSLHTAVDIFTHADDGPVLLFPLNWHTRFHSPISYWDAAHYGRLFRVFEHLLDLLLVGYLFFKKQ
ncbi:MAG: hypothetical protein GY803_14515 [Chloroflexi bacterium]|nr:hypothetical protein [Chloroflexota bacterium]